MILDTIIGMCVGILNGVLGLIPAYELPASMTGLGASIGSAAATANGVFPMVTLGLCISIVVGARVFIFAFATLAWIYNKIPLKFT